MMSFDPSSGPPPSVAIYRNRKTYLARATKHPLIVAVVTGIFGIIAVLVAAFYQSHDSATSDKRISDLENRLEEVGRERDALSAQVSELRSARTETPASAVIESFVLPNHRFVGILDKKYIVTVTDIAMETATIEINDLKGFKYSVFMGQGSQVTLAAQPQMRCILKVTDVDANKVSLGTECVPQSTTGVSQSFETPWVPLAATAEIRLKGISFIYDFYLNRGSEVSAASILVNGNKRLITDGGFINISGENGQSCVVKAKDIKLESVDLQLNCY